MKIKHLPLLGVVLIFAALFVSCDDDDDNGDPAGTIAVNMLNEDNGKTLLGNSDVYIDNAHNFYGPSCSIASLGKKNGMAVPPVLDGLGTKVAVETGNTYQIFRSAAIRQFLSGKLALNITADYYNVYVTSQIKQDEEVVGATVKFKLEDVPTYGLPEVNTHIGILDHNDYYSEIRLTLPTSDFECEPSFASSYYYTLEYEKDGNDLVVSLVDYKLSDVFGFYIRIQNSYTYVYGNVR